MKKVLITGMGGDIAQGIATILRESYPDYYLVGTDLSEYNAAKFFVDSLYIVPSADLTLDYIADLKKIIESESIDIVIPTTESELRVLELETCDSSDASFITCGKKVIEIGIDKLKTIDYLASLGLHVPWTQLASTGIPNRFPCILKDRFGSGSRNLFIVSCKDDAKYLSEKYSNSVFQELLLPDDKEVTCAVYRDQNNNVAVLQLLRRLTGGFTSWAKVINSSEIQKICVTIAEALSLKGSMNIQLRITNEGVRIFEINPRFSSTVLMRHRMGFSDVLWAIEEVNGKSVQLKDVEIGKIGARFYNAITY